MKRKTMTLVLCLLAALALVSVGFASWVISVDANKEQTGNITVDTVTDQRLSLEVSLAEGSKPDLTFGKNDSNNSNHWFYNNGDLTENLTVVYNVKVTADGKAITPKTITVDLTETSETYKTASDAKVVGALPTVTAEPVTDKVGEYTITIKLTWGEKFGGNNPCDYFKGKDIDGATGLAETEPQTWGDYAAKYMKEVEKIKNASYKLTITVSNK